MARKGEQYNNIAFILMYFSNTKSFDFHARAPPTNTIDFLSKISGIGGFKMENETRYYIPSENGLIDVPEEIYLAFQSAERKTKYLVEQDQAHGISYYGFLDVEEIANREELKGGILISAEDEVIRKEMYDQLHRCIESLPRAERELIKAIFFKGSLKKNMPQKLD